MGASGALGGLAHQGSHFTRALAPIGHPSHAAENPGIRGSAPEAMPAGVRCHGLYPLFYVPFCTASRHPERVAEHRSQSGTTAQSKYALVQLAKVMEYRKMQRIDYVLLTLVLAIAAAFRVTKLDAPLWYDEIFSLTHYVRLPLGELLFDHSSSFNNHLFYNVQAKGAMWLFGESNWSLRLPAVVFGVASIAAMWRLAYLVSGIPQAHVSALLIAFSYHHVWFSQNARGYTELMFWFITSTLLLIRGIREPSLKTWVAYGVLLAAAMCTHLTAAPFFIVHALIVLAFMAAPMLNRGRRGPPTAGPRLRWSMPIVGFLIGGGLTVAAYAPSLGQLIHNISAVKVSSEVDVMTEYQSPVWTVREIARTLASPGPLAVVAALATTLFVGIGIAESHRREPILGAVLLMHIPLTLIILLALSTRIWPRFFFADMGFVLFFLTQGVFASCEMISRIVRRKTGANWSGRTLFQISAVLMLMISSLLLVRNYRFPKQNLAGAVAFVESQRTEEDETVTLGVASVVFADYFRTGWSPVETAAELQSVQSEAGRTWLVMAFPHRTTRKYADVMNQLGRHFVLAREFRGTLGDGNVVVYVENRKLGGD